MRNVEGGSKLRAGRALDAMLGPQNLRAVMELDRREVRTTMARCKGMMAWRMPILRQHDMRKLPRNTIDQGNDRVTIGHRQSAARHEVVLHIDDEKNVAIRKTVWHTSRSLRPAIRQSVQQRLDDVHRQRKDDRRILVGR